MTGLIATARRLARGGATRPSRADLGKAVSAAYYALFHAMARDCADLIVGTGKDRSEAAWNHAYRALEHGFAKNACRSAAGQGLDPKIVGVADTFVELQEERHRADYDPAVTYTRMEVDNIIRVADEAIASLRRAPRRDRRAFAVLLLLQRR